MSQYDDIINLPYNKSTKRPHMSMHDRAAQFSPFKALTGHDEAIEETARLTEKFSHLDESEKEQINRVIYYVVNHTNVPLTITYFIPDELKSGGAYKTITGCIKKYDEIQNKLIYKDGTIIPIYNIYSAVIDDMDNLLNGDDNYKEF